VLVVLNHERRKIVHFNITDAPTAAWTAQQIINAFPYDTAPEYLLRDRDSIYGSVFVQRVAGMGIKQKLISPRSPWQSPYVQRLVGSIRRECLDRVIVFNERQLRRILQSYFEYYHKIRPHRSLSHDSPIPRPVETPAKWERDRDAIGWWSASSLPTAGSLSQRYHVALRPVVREEASRRCNACARPSGRRSLQRAHCPSENRYVPRLLW
jgi:transposase InsO family protein